MAAWVKVRECRPGLLWPRQNGSPVCDDSASESNAQMRYYISELYLTPFKRVYWV